MSTPECPDRGDTLYERRFGSERRKRKGGPRNREVQPFGRMPERIRGLGTDRRRSPEDVRGADVGEARAMLEADRDQIVDWLTRRAQWYRMIEAGGGGQLTPEIAGSDAAAFEETAEFIGDHFSTAEPSAEPATGRDQKMGVTDREVPSAGGEPRYTLAEVADMLEATAGPDMLGTTGSASHYTRKGWKAAAFWLRLVRRAAPEGTGGNDP